MTNTFKKCAIFFCTAMWLVLSRILFSVLNLSDNVSDWLFTLIVQGIGLCAIPLVLGKVLLRDETLVEVFALKGKTHPLVYLIAVLLGIFLHLFVMTFSTLWQNVAILLGYVPTNSAGTIYSGPEVLILSILCTAVFPAFCEELTYRGLGSSMLRGVKDDSARILLLGLLFGLGHQFILQTGYTFFVGLVLAFLVVRTKSIFPGVIVHFLNNFFSLFSDYSRQHNGVYYAVTNAIESVLFKSYGTVLLTMAFSIAVIVALLFAVKKLTAVEEKQAKNEETYYFPNTSQYVDDLFGKNFSGELRAVEEKTHWYDYAFLYATFAAMTINTIFTFVWGVI